MSKASSTDVTLRLSGSYGFDELWGETTGFLHPNTTQEPLRLVTELLELERVPYAVIGGVAVRLHTQEPTSARHIELAVLNYSAIPRHALLRSGFECLGRSPRGDDWIALGTVPESERTSIHFSAETEAVGEAVTRAAVVEADGLRLRLAAPSDIVILRLALAEEPHRAAVQCGRDIADILALVEEWPQLRAAVPRFADRLQRLRERASDLVARR